MKAKEAAEAAAAELAAAAAAEKAAAAELSACVEAAFRVFNDLDVDAAGVWGEEVQIRLSDQFHNETVNLAIGNLLSEGHIYYAAESARWGIPRV